MNSHGDLKSEFRRALEEVTPPAPWLVTQIREGLVERRSRRRVPAGPRLAAVAVGALAVIIAVAVVIASRSSAPPASIPSAERQTTARYVALVDAGYLGLKSMQHFEILHACITVDEVACPQEVSEAKAEANKFLDDLAGTKPPARLAGADMRLRTDLVGFVRALDAVQAAFDSRNQDALVAADQGTAAAGASVISDVFDILYPSTPPSPK